MRVVTPRSYLLQKTSLTFPSDISDFILSTMNFSQSSKRWRKRRHRNASQNFNFIEVNSKALMICYSSLLLWGFSNNPVAWLPAEELDIKLHKCVYMLYIPPHTNSVHRLPCISPEHCRIFYVFPPNDRVSRECLVLEFLVSRVKRWVVVTV